MMPILYTAELGLEEEDVPIFLDWYAFRHVPDIVACGFSICCCYRAVEGDMTFLDLYELPSRKVFTNPRYTRLAVRDVYAPAILGKRRDKSNTLYRQRAIAQNLSGDGPTLDADWVTAVRFEASAGAAGAVEDGLRGEATRLFALGALRLRFAERTENHPVYTTHRPRWIALAEWPRRPPHDASLAAVLDSLSVPGVTEVKPFTGFRVYPWPDDSSLLADPSPTSEPGLQPGLTGVVPR